MEEVRSVEIRKIRPLYWLGRVVGGLYLLTHSIEELSNSFSEARESFVRYSSAITDTTATLRKSVYVRAYHLLRSDRLAWWVAYNLPVWLLWHIEGEEIR